MSLLLASIFFKEESTPRILDHEEQPAHDPDALDYALFRRFNATSPTSPLPSSQTAAGMGTALTT
jgi:hypothetical protein